MLPFYGLHAVNRGSLTPLTRRPKKDRNIIIYIISHNDGVLIDNIFIAMLATSRLHQPHSDVALIQAAESDQYILEATIYIRNLTMSYRIY